jgi:hypothetical protein
MRLALLRLDSPLGISRDGFPRGSRVPRWRLPDLNEELHQVPSGKSWQLLLFSDHSLREFPQLAQAIERLRAEEPELEALLLPRLHPEAAEETAKLLGLNIPIVPVDERFYWRHNVRVMPFVFFVDPAGIVQGSGLVGEETQLRATWLVSRARAPERRETPMASARS